MSPPSKVWAVLPAAGAGTRMQNNTPKQYLRIADKTVLEHSIEVLLSNIELAALVVCVPEQDTTARRLVEHNQVLAECLHRQQIVFTAGGSSRAQSVLNGLFALTGRADEHDWVLVHDAARPCVESDDLRLLYDSLVDDPIGGLLAVPARDTLKIAQDERVVSTLKRDEIWHALTPQMFRYGVLKTALSDAIEQGFAITDESSALEHAGFRPKLVKGSVNNIKITTAHDLLIAEQFLL